MFRFVFFFVHVRYALFKYPIAVEENSSKVVRGYITQSFGRESVPVLLTMTRTSQWKYCTSTLDECLLEYPMK